MIKNFVTPEDIRSITGDLIRKVMEARDQNVILDKDQGEESAVIILYESEDIPMFTVGIINTENTIVRFEHTKPVNEMVEELIKNI